MTSILVTAPVPDEALLAGYTWTLQEAGLSAGADAGIRVRLDGAQGEVIATVCVGRTEGNYDFRTFSAPVCGKLSGKHAVYLEFFGKSGKLMNLKELYFI